MAAPLPQASQAGLGTVYRSILPYRSKRVEVPGIEIGGEFWNGPNAACLACLFSFDSLVWHCDELVPVLQPRPGQVPDARRGHRRQDWAAMTLSSVFTDSEPLHQITRLEV